MINYYLDKVMKNENLSIEEAKEAMNHIMEGKVNNIMIAAFLAALKIKKENIDEISGFALSMKEKAKKVECKDIFAIDTCGTGGDHKGTINISTAAAIVASAAGVKVAKHGNRSISSKSGSADVLEELGIDINKTPEEASKMIEEEGFAFLFAPNYHKSMKYAMPVRRGLNTRTVFNILGPLCNPCNIKGQVMGVFDKELVVPIANVLKNIGLEHALVVHGLDGSDEFSIESDTYVAELKDGEIKDYIVKPFEKIENPNILGKSAKENARILEEIFNGTSDKDKTEVVLLNAAASIYVGNRLNSIEEGYEVAKDVIKNGLAAKKLDVLRGGADDS